MADLDDKVVSTNTGFLDELLGGLHDAVVSAQRLVEKQHIDMVDLYFDDETGQPLTMDMKIPSAHPDKDFENLSVPLFTLAPLSSIKITKSESVHFTAWNVPIWKIPENLNDLQKLPGVGRKTANVIGSVYFDIPAMPVDTHVFRVSDRIGLTTRAKNPLEAELQLLKLFPKKKLNIAHHWLILHGRYVCKARRPECERCKIISICKYFSRK